MVATNRGAVPVHWRDTGCEEPPYFSRSCFTCPLPQCRYDLPPKRALAIMREVELYGLLRDGLSADAAAARLGVSRRSVFRLKRGAASGANPLIKLQVTR